MENTRRPKQRLGQNFLRSQTVLEKIVIAAKLNKNETVLEIGTGNGNLTRFLAQSAGRVITVEKDRALLAIAQHNLKEFANITFINQDVLSLAPERLRLKNYKVVGNIPYYLTGKLLELVLEEWSKPKLIVFLVQKEVAEKLLTQRKRSTLTVITQLLAKVEPVARVSRKLFWPEPKVDSVVIRLFPFSQNVFEQNPGLKKLIKSGFSHPRKLLISNLKTGLNLTEEKLLASFIKLSLSPKCRAENLTPTDWLNLQQTIQKAQ